MKKQRPPSEARFTDRKGRAAVPDEVAARQRPHAFKSRSGETWRARGEAPPPDTRNQEKFIRVSGLPSVAEVFKTSADRVERLYFDAAAKDDAQPFCAHLARRRKVYRQVGADEMLRVAGTAMHGGIVALVRPRTIRELDLSSAETWAKAGKPLLVLDGIGNPQNIGAIARTAAFFGVQHMLFSSHPAQAGLSDASYRVAKGALEHIEIHRAVDLADTLRRLGAFYDVIGTAIGKGKDLKVLERSKRPVALVLGNEEDGLAPATLAACGSIVSLTGSSKVQSLNVSAATAILVHALLARP